MTRIRRTQRLTTSGGLTYACDELTRKTKGDHATAGHNFDADL